MKICSKCHLEKEETEFYHKTGSRTKLKARCKSCGRAACRQNYINNKPERKAKALIRQRRWKKWYQEKKGNLKCGKCGESFGACLEFHHRNPSKKEYSISTMIGRGWPFSKIEEEMDKCDILCANCHRKLHAKLKDEATKY